MKMHLGSALPPAAAVVAAVVAAGCAGIRTMDAAQVPTATLAELEADPAAWGLGTAEWEGPLIVRIPAGETVPLRLALDVPFATLDAGANSVRFEREVLFYLSRGELLVSPDGRRWADLSDWTVVRELFGLESGTFAIGFGVNAETGAAFTVAVAAQ
jgi:hypothetical protein